MRANPRWRRRKQHRPAELIDAAVEVFCQQGFARTRLDDVARRAGVTKGTLYLYFKSKEALFEAVVQQSIAPQLEEARTMVEQHDGSASDLLRTVVTQWWRVISGSPVREIHQLVLAEAAAFPGSARFYYDEVVLPAEELFARAIERGITLGDIRPVDPRGAARALMGPLLLAATWARSLGPYQAGTFDPDAFIGLQLDLFLHGIVSRRL